MGRHVLSVQGHNPDEIRTIFRLNENYMVGIRLYAIYLVSIGYSSRKLEELYGTSFKQITNWVHRFEKEGINGLIDRPGKGRKSRLSVFQKNEIRELLLNHKPAKFGEKSEKWSVPEISEMIKKRYQVEYKIAQVYNILKELGINIKASRQIA